MGGFGSGKWLRPQKKRVVEDCLDIDIRYLARVGLLYNITQKTFVLTWLHNGLETNQVKLSVLSGKITIHYQQFLQGENAYREQHVTIVYTPCHYGRQRPWFRCPNCIGRCAIIYLGDQGFHCRKCYQLPYRSQQICKLDQLISKRVTLEEKLFNSSKGLHYRTRERLKDRLNEIENRIAAEVMQ